MLLSALHSKQRLVAKNKLDAESVTLQLCDCRLHPNARAITRSAVTSMLSQQCRFHTFSARSGSHLQTGERVLNKGQSSYRREGMWIRVTPDALTRSTGTKTRGISNLHIFSSIASLVATVGTGWWKGVEIWGGLA